MTAEEKRPYVEHLVRLFIDWFQEKSGSEKNDLSTLKVLKLIFFVSAINSTPDSEDTLLDRLFNNYVAMPYGHVESDVYDLIKGNYLIDVEVTNRNSKVINHESTAVLNQDLKKQLEESFSKLKEVNGNLILASSFQLVDLSHSWYSWQYFYSLAEESNISSLKIDLNIIKQEDKIFLV